MADNDRRDKKGKTTGLSRLLHSPGFKFVLIGLIILFLLIPLFMVWGMVSERERNARRVRAEIAASWGREQNITGPFLIIPFERNIDSLVGGKPVSQKVERLAIFLPEKLSIKAHAKSRRLYRSIYEASVYDARLEITGNFAAPDFSRLAPEATRIKWQKAIFVIGLSSLAGLREGAELHIDGSRKAISFEPSAGLGVSAFSAIHVRLLEPGANPQGGLPSFRFSTRLAFKGSERISFAPAGRETVVQISSDWPHPSFKGAFLPIKRQIGPKGFEAEWKIPNLARPVPQSWVGRPEDLIRAGNASRQIAFPPPIYGKRPVSIFSGGIGPERFNSYRFGVQFYIPIDHYDLVNRALKYGLMFLLIGFAGVFVMELLSRRRVHGVQYVFVGLMMVMFFLLLLALGEHIGFLPAYLTAALATGGTLSLYVGKIHHSRRKGEIMLGIYGLLYGFLYLILRLEDYALLAGAIAGFAMLAATMFLTLKVDWSGGGET